MSVQRLQGLYRTATDEEKATGLLWYSLANEEVVARANKYDLSPRVIAGIMSALSPNIHWEQSLVDTDHLLSLAELAGTGSDLELYANVTTYPSNLKRAISILQGVDPQQALSGPRAFKIPVFFRNLLGDWSEPCIDSHAINAWHGRRVVGSKLRLSHPVTTFRKVRADYIRAALNRKLTPAEFQATIWVTWKRRVASGTISGYTGRNHDPERQNREEG